MITDCQIGVFAAYVSNHGHALIDRQLYLPKDWAADRRRRAGTHVPAKVVFATKPALAARMIGRAVAAHVPFSWVSGDSVYGVGEIEMLLRCLGKGYVLGVTGNHYIWSWNTWLSISGTAADIAHRLEPSCWRCLSAGARVEGGRMYDWVHLELATLAAAEFNAGVPGLWTRGLLIRRSLCDQGLAFFITWSPAGTPIETLARVEGARWAIEKAFARLKAMLRKVAERTASEPDRQANRTVSAR